LIRYTLDCAQNERITRRGGNDRYEGRGYRHLDRACVGKEFRISLASIHALGTMGYHRMRMPRAATFAQDVLAIDAAHCREKSKFACG
jgi:hypothetical protein